VHKKGEIKMFVLENSLSSEEWDTAVKQFECATLFQSYEWGELMKEEGIKIKRFAVNENGRLLCLAQCEEMGPSLARILYCPRGPVCDYDSEDGRRVLSVLLENVREYARKRNIVFLRVNPEVRLSREIMTFFRGLKLKTLGKYPPPLGLYKGTFKVDLTVDFFSKFEKRVRYNIRKAQRQGVVIISDTSSEVFQDFYKVLKYTSSVKKFVTPRYDFLKKMWATLAEKSMGKIFLAKYNRQVLGGLLITRFGSECKVKWAGSYSDHAIFRQTSPNELLHFEAMKWAQRSGCQTYDLSGVGVSVEPGDLGWEIFLYKRGFGGEYLEYVGEYDMVFKPILYYLINQIAILPFYSRRKGVLFPLYTRLKRAFFASH